MLKTIKTNINLFVKTFKSTMKVYKGEYQWEECNLDGITYYKANDHVKMLACAYGAATRDALGRKMILTDEYFEQLSINGKAFVLAHELGHIVNGHLDMDPKEIKRINRRRMFLRNRVNKIELEADAHAVKLIGKEKAIEALKEIYELQIEITGKKDKEIELRINAIERI